MIEQPNRSKQRGTQYKVRLPDELHAWLKEVASQNERSMNYLIVKAIKNMRKQSEGAKA